MTPLVGFATFLAVTLVLIGGVVVTGKRAQRRRHLPLVALTVVSLATTIYWAEQLGDQYDLGTAGWIAPLHLTIAKIATLAYLAPVVSGLRTLRRPATRVVHGKAAFAVIALTVLTAITGAWMVLASEPLSAP